ncbi:MAG: hypothetical protein ACTHOH_05920 [Lysobacteraceae bacterium]
MSALTLGNTTSYIAQFVVSRSQQVIARVPGLAPGAQLQVPVTDDYTVIATTVIDGNTYTSAPLNVTGAASFLAQVRQDAAQGTYVFEVVESPSTSPDELQFQKTTLGPVTFTLSRNGALLQNVVVTDSFETKTVQTAQQWTAYAIVNGITTAPVMTTNPDATITAVLDTSTLEQGYFTLVVS